MRETCPDNAMLYSYSVDMVLQWIVVLNSIHALHDAGINEKKGSSALLQVISTKVLAINTSPEKERGVVSLLLEPFLDGLRESGAEAELCYACDLMTGKSPEAGDLLAGKSKEVVDMQRLRQKIGRADVLVLASPLYFDGRTGPGGATPSLRMLLEQLVPGTHMSADRPYGHAVHTVREDVSLRRVVIASGSGFWEIDGLCPVLTHVKALCQNTFPEFAGNITGTRGVMLRGALPRGMLDWDLISAARETGCQLAREETVPPTAHDIVRREAVTRGYYSQIVNSSSHQRAASYAMPDMVRCTQKED